MASLLFKGGHLGFKCTEGAGVGAYSGKARGEGGGGAFQLQLKDHTARKTLLRKGLH